MSMLRNKFSLSRYVPRRTCFFSLCIQARARAPQVEFAELKETVNDRANIGGTITGAPIVGQ